MIFYFLKKDFDLVNLVNDLINLSETLLIRKERDFCRVLREDILYVLKIFHYLIMLS
jgi:hypothetical protein